MMKNLTVFIPTFNRAYILPQLYKSLERQTNKEFVWLIVAYFIHGSMLLPAMAFLLARYYHNTNLLYYFG